ncbi:MAG TPA: hypothetical protein PLC42_04230 [Parachlamydiaceae bacterium]|nr:hypothetical protein [Parachlamydiaceae bacterium]
MLASYSNLCSPSFSYLINYEIQSRMYNWFDKITDERQWLRLPGICIWTASNIGTIITRIAGVVETFFNGTSVLLSAPFTDNCLSNATLGLRQIFVHTPKNFLRTIFIPVEFIFGAAFNFAAPKYFTILMSECMKVNLNHAKAGTIESKEHYIDLFRASGTSYSRLIKHQKA